MSKDQELREDRLVFYRNDLARIDRVLEEFLRLAGASSVLLIDKEGHMITRAGKAPSFDQDTISALVAGSFSATREMARLLGEKEFSALYHQGERDNIQLSLVGDRTILTVLFDDSTTLGMVRLYVVEAVRKLEDLFVELGRGHKEPNAEARADLAELSNLKNSAKDTLDALFDGN
ncbi:MAG: roadblock/LC7 domain-containing protein [Planctomycetes bacterium]|nr:roadblock/LC7 domain-containing protein [Planctomycetota bacterium]